MRLFKNLFIGIAAVTAVALSGCQDDFDTMDVEVPVATKTANTTIAELKDAFWQTETNYCGEIGTKENGEHYIIKGTVISSDEAGNIFKCLYIRDETAALPMSINRYNLYLDYRVGQEVVIDLTGMYIGKYNGMLQLGYPEWYEQGNCWETSFMAPVLFSQHTELNGLPIAEEEVEPVVIKDLSSIDKANAEDLKKWQGQLVRFNDATFANPGTTLCDEYHSSGFNQALNVQGGSINIRTSGYAKFWNMVVPEGHHDVVGILGFYSGDWQLLLRYASDIKDFATENVGTKNNPYDIEQVIEMENNGSSETGWVKGYIVGAVAPEVTEVKSNEDIEWGDSEVTLQNTLVIAPDKDCKDFSKCIVVILPQDSKLRELGNLVTNPGNYQKEIKLVGAFNKVMGTYGITGNNGTLSEFSIEGMAVEGKPIEEGDGTEASPYNPTQVLAGSGSGSTGWIKGYIVGYVADKALATSAQFTVPATIASNILVATEPDCKDPNKCVPVQLVNGTDIRKAVNLMDNPGNLGAVVALEGSFTKYFGVNALKEPTNYVLNGAGGGGETPSGDKTFNLLTANVTSGKAYMFYADGAAAKPVDSPTATYGWLYTNKLTASGNTIKAAESYGFVFNAVSGGYTIRDNSGRYLYMSGTYDSFQLAKEVASGDKTFVWTVARNTDGTYKITNTGNGKSIMYSTQYTSFGAYAEETGRVYPTLYEMEGIPSDPGTQPDPTPVTGPGSESQPYSVSDVIGNKASGTSVWVEGYIVGWVDGKTLSEGAKFNADATVASNILIAASADETDLSKCIPVQLPSGEVRNALNLQANPGNYKKKVALKGSIEKYFGTTGVKSVTAYKIDGAGGGDTPTPGPSDGGTLDKPFSVSQVIKGEATGTGVYIQGYIVGWVDGAKLETGAKFTAESTSDTNILIAEEVGCTDVAKCVPVQVPSALRPTLGLKTNSGNFGKLVELKGDITLYFNVNGMKNTKEAIFK